MKSPTDSSATVASFVVRIYRRDNGADPQVAGTVQLVGGDARPFRSAEELWSALTDKPARRPRRGKGAKNDG